MKRLILASLLFTSVSLQAEVVKIYPIGDSITQAYTGHFSYRMKLWQKLIKDGYQVDFVGSMSKPFGGVVATPNSGKYPVVPTGLLPWNDTQSDGHWGWRADEILNGKSGYGATNNLKTWVNQTSSSVFRSSDRVVALIHLGTNDAIQQLKNPTQTPVSTATDIRLIIDHLSTVNPGITILLAKVIPATSPLTPVATADPTRNQRLTNLNKEIAKIPGTTKSRVILVDMNTDYKTIYNYDGVHPNPDGEEFVAKRWYKALKNVLPAPPAASINQ